MAEVVIQVRPNGPYKITGPVSLIGPDGAPIPLEDADEAIFLCRCGESKEKPFCDGTHKECSFRPDGD